MLPCETESGCLDEFVLERSPIVVLGTVASIRIQQERLALRGFRRAELDQLAVELTVEAVIEGTVPASRISFELWAPTSIREKSGLRLYRPEVGERAVYFLRANERGGLVAGGHVKHYPMISATGVPEVEMRGSRWDKIARVLLTPGSGANRAALAATLPIIVGRLSDRSSRDEVRTLLYRLLADTDYEVRFEACRILSEQFYGQYGCWLAIAGERSQTQRSTEEIKAMYEAQRSFHIGLVRRLACCPAEALGGRSRSDSVVVLKADLAMLTDSPDREVASAGCSAYERMFGPLDACRKRFDAPGPR